MVVLAIIVVLSSIVLNNQSSFNKTILLANTAYDIALTIRSTETYGLSSRAAGTAANVGYGIHFSTSGVANNSFAIFADTSGGTSCAGMPPDCKPGDRVYNAPGFRPDVLEQTYNLNNGVVIHDFCAFSGVGGWSCAAGGAISSLDIVFVRPSPAPFMSTNGSYSASPFSVTAACLAIASPNAPGGPYRFVSIGSSGQIVANAVSCP